MCVGEGQSMSLRTRDGEIERKRKIERFMSVSSTLNYFLFYPRSGLGSGLPWTL